MKKWTVEESSVALPEPWFRIRRDKVLLPNGAQMDDYFVWEENNAAEVVPVTAENEIVLVRQYKHGAQEITIEIPAGYMNKGELPFEAAKRELREETGFESKKWKTLSIFTIHPTKSESRHFLYLARDVEKTGTIHLDKSEEIEVLVEKYQRVFKMIENGEINVASSIAAIFLASRKLGWLTK